MKHLSYLMLLFAISVSCIWSSATPVSPTDALNRLQKSNQNKIKKLHSLNQYRIAEILTDSCNNNTVYIFDSESGFVVTPADDVLPPVLGYGNAPLHDLKGDLPDGFRGWLDHINKQISEFAASGEEITYISSVGDPIEPLCKTSWGQGEPYNSECPEYNGEKCLSGCVATAMAQIMKYHNWPPKGKGDLEYVTDRTGLKIYTDFSKYEFDWANMLDEYGSPDDTELQREAVAHLMRGVGGSVAMNYSPTASGADYKDAIHALLENWDYGEDMRYMRRNYFSLQDWSQILYDALKDCGPILYGGFSFSSAHAFVCDGYDGEGMFHFNWGWDGKANGYFVIDFLNPVVEGEPSKTGYNGGQTALINLFPRNHGKPGTRTYDIWTDSYYVNPSTHYSDEATHILHPGESFTMNGNCENYGPFAIPAGSQFATIFTSCFDGASIPTNIVEIPTDINMYGSFNQNQKVVPSGLPDGIYSMKNNIYINAYGWANIFQHPYASKYCAVVENHGSDIHFIETPYIPELVNSDIPDRIDLNSTNVFQASLRNPINHTAKRYVRAELVQNGIVKGWTPNIAVSFKPEETIDFAMTADKWIWKNEATSHSGDYILCLSTLNSYGNIWIPMGTGKNVAVTESAGIGDVISDTQTHNGRYDLFGRKIPDASSTLPPGIYITIRNGKASKTLHH